MSNAPTIVCAVDFSDHSKVALDWACAWARHFGARLMVVTVVEPLLVNAAAATYDMDLVREEVLPELRQFVGTTDAAVRARRMSPEYVVLVGEPAAEIVALAQRERAQLIVMATHGLSGYRKMLVGSTTEKVLRQVTVPVLIAPPSDQGLPAPHSLTTGFGHVLVPVDFKDESSRDLRAGAAIARTLGVRLVMLHVVAPINGLERLRPHIDVQSRSVRGGRARGPATHVQDPGVDRHRICYSDRIACGGNSQDGSRARRGADCHGPAASGTLPGGGQGRSPIAC